MILAIFPLVEEGRKRKKLKLDPSESCVAVRMHMKAFRYEIFTSLLMYR